MAPVRGRNATQTPKAAMRLALTGHDGEEEAEEDDDAVAVGLGQGGLATEESLGSVGVACIVDAQLLHGARGLQAGRRGIISASAL